MFDVNLKAEGFERLDKELKLFKADIKTKARRAGLVEMAKPIKKTLKSEIPIGRGYDNTGALSKSIGHASVSKSDKGALGLGVNDEAIIVGATRKVLDRSYKKRFQHYKLNWLDKGVKPHIIRAKKGGSLKFGGRHVQEVLHSGVQARGLLQRAYSQHQGSFENLWSVGAAKALRRFGAKVA